MTHFIRSLAVAIGVALPMSACGGTTHGNGKGDAGTGGFSCGDPQWHGSCPAAGGSSLGTGGIDGVGGIAMSGGVQGAGGTPVESGGWTAAGGTTVEAGGWTAAGGTMAAGGTIASGGALPTAGTGGVETCCLAVPTCAPGEGQIAGPDACVDSGCHSVTACCTTIWCDRAACTASCKPGQLLETGPCRSNFGCTTHTLCGITYACYWPLDAGSVDSGPPGSDCPPPGVHLVTRDPGVCARIDPVCPAQTTYYSGDCGCGCKQDESCPVSVDCSPTVPPGPHGPLCSDTAMCPYTVRAF
jgi:hypothetical protein